MQRYSNTITTGSGRAIVGAQIAVKTTAGALAVIYADDGITTRANPIRSGAAGYFEFYAAPGDYSLSISGAGISANVVGMTLTAPPVVVTPPAPDIGPLAAASGASLVGFQQAGTGSVARTVQDKLRDVVSVKDFGAKGDGTTDDTAAIQAAINSGAPIITGGGLTYAVRQVNGRSNLNLRSFKLNKIASAANGVNALNFESLDASNPISNVLLEDVKINGNRSSETGIVAGSAEDGGRSGFRFRGYVDGVTLRRCSANLCGTDGLIIFATMPTPGAMKNIIAEDCEFSDNRRHGISADSLKYVKFRNTVARRNGLTRNGQTVTTHGDFGANYGAASPLYGNGMDLETYKAGDHSEDVQFIDCDMTGNARAGLLLLEQGAWKDGGYSPWRNIIVRGGKYDKGVDPSSEGNSIMALPNTATYTPGAPKFIKGLRITDVDLVNAAIFLRYCDDTEISVLGNSVSTPTFIVIAQGESNVYLANLKPAAVYVDQNAVVSYRVSNPTVSQFPTPNFFKNTGPGSVSAVQVTKLSESTLGAEYRITATYTPVGATDAANLFIGNVAKAQVRGCGLTSTVTGAATGKASPAGNTVNVKVESTDPVTVEVSVLVYP